MRHHSAPCPGRTRDVQCTDPISPAWATDGSPGVRAPADTRDMGRSREPEPEWGVRLADVRISRYWPVALIASAVILKWRDRREIREVARVGRDLAEITVNRWETVDGMQRDLRKFTARVALLSWALLLVATATLFVGVVTLVK